MARKKQSKANGNGKSAKATRTIDVGSYKLAVDKAKKQEPAPINGLGKTVQYVVSLTSSSGSVPVDYWVEQKHVEAFDASDHLVLSAFAEAVEEAMFAVFGKEVYVTYYGHNGDKQADGLFGVAADTKRRLLDFLKVKDEAEDGDKFKAIGSVLSLLQSESYRQFVEAAKPIIKEQRDAKRKVEREAAKAEALAKEKAKQKAKDESGGRKGKEKRIRNPRPTPPSQKVKVQPVKKGSPKTMKRNAKKSAKAKAKKRGKR